MTTFAEIADVPLPEHKVDGVSLVSLLKQVPDANPRSTFYYYYRRNDLEAVTDGLFKLIFPHKHRTYEGFLPGNDGAPGKVNEFYPLNEKWLIDLRRDPGERYNVIKLYPEIAERLEKVAEEAREDLGDNLTKSKGRNRRPVGRVKDVSH